MLDWISPKNLGTLDRIRRITIGGVFMSLVFVGPQTLLALIGLYPIVTGIFGRCPICKWLEVDTLDHDEVPAPREAPTPLVTAPPHALPARAAA